MHKHTHTHSIKLPNHFPYTTAQTSVTRNTTYLGTITFLKSAGTLAKIQSFCRQTTYNTICLLLHHIHHLVAVSHRRTHSTKHAVYQTLRWNRSLCPWGQFRNCQGIRNITDHFLLIHWHFQLMNFHITKTKSSEKLYPSVIYVYFPNTSSLILHIQISIRLFFQSYSSCVELMAWTSITNS